MVVSKGFCLASLLAATTGKQTHYLPFGLANVRRAAGDDFGQDDISSATKLKKDFKEKPEYFQTGLCCSLIHYPYKPKRDMEEGQQREFFFWRLTSR